MMAVHEWVVFKNQNNPPPQKTSRKINGKQVGIGFGDWQRLAMDANCPLIDQWRSEKISFPFNLNSEILTRIVKINFPNLRHLRLQGNNLESIESLNKIYAPSLYMLSLNKNKLRNVNSLVKSNLPNLSVLHLNNNPLQQVEELNKVQLNQEKRVKMYLESYISDPDISNNLNWIFKLQTDKLKTLWIRSDRRISVRSLKEMVRKKWKNIQINQKPAELFY